MRKLNAIFRTALLALVGLVLGINLYLWNAGSLMGDALPMPFGYGTAVVLSGSMEPAFSQGDLILVRQKDSYTQGDIVVYQDSGSLVVHRILEISSDTVITKGDANDAADPPIATSAIKGSVLFWIPGAGHVVSFLKSPVGAFFMIAAAIALIEIPRQREKRKDAQQRQALLDEIRQLKDELP